MPFGGYVLVGGKSSRFGSDKALLAVQGGQLAARVADAVVAAVGEVSLVGSPAKYAALGFRVIPDVIAGAGPLGGILAALEDSEHEWNLIAACDMPRVRADFLKFLIHRAAQSQADVVLPLNREGLPEPLCAAYRRGASSAFRKRLETGVYKITKAFEGLNVVELGADLYAEFDPDGRLFANINTLPDAREAGLMS